MRVSASRPDVLTFAAIAAATALAACGSAKPAAVHTPSPSPTSAAPARTPSTPLPSLPTTAADALRAAWNKVDSDSWLTTAETLPQSDSATAMHDNLQRLAAQLETYRTELAALKPPPACPLFEPLKKPIADIFAGITAMETMTRTLDGDLQRGDSSALQNDVGALYDHVESLAEASQLLGVDIQSDAFPGGSSPPGC